MTKYSQSLLGVKRIVPMVNVEGRRCQPATMLLRKVGDMMFTAAVFHVNNRTELRRNQHHDKYRARRECEKSADGPAESRITSLNGAYREMLSRNPKRQPLEFGSPDMIAAADRDAELIARELSSALRAALIGARTTMFGRRRWEHVCDIQTPSARYVVLRQPHPAAIGSQSLTESERRVVELAAYGLSPKESAYELGVSHSTVRVLLMRAARKFGVRSRAELMVRLRIPSPT